MEDLRDEGTGRDAAVRELHAALIGRLRKALAGRGTDDSFIEDAVQDSVLRILDRLDQFQGRSLFLTWATAIAIRLAMAELRRKRWKHVSLEDVLGNAEFPAENGHVEDFEIETNHRKLIGVMRDIIQTQLTLKQRTALLAELKGMPQDEIARHTGSNRNAVYKLTHDARRKLKHALESAGYTAEDVLATISN